MLEMRTVEMREIDEVRNEFVVNTARAWMYEVGMEKQYVIQFLSDKTRAAEMAEAARLMEATEEEVRKMQSVALRELNAVRNRMSKNMYDILKSNIEAIDTFFRYAQKGMI